MRDLLLLCTLLLAGCQGAAPPPDTYVQATSKSIVTLDPAYAYDAASLAVISNVYEPLISCKNTTTSEYEPVLSAEVPSLKNGRISDDRTTYVFPIRKGIFFHDGTPLTPEDAKYSLMRLMLQDREGGPSSLLLRPILGTDSTRNEQGHILTYLYREADQNIQIHGNDLIIHLKHPWNPFLAVMARWSFVLPKPWAVRHGDWDGTETTWTRYNNPEKTTFYISNHMNGTGPYLLESWKKQARQIVLLRNDRYWKKTAALTLRRILIQEIQDFAARKRMLLLGDADSIDVERRFLSQIQAVPGVETTDGLSPIQIDPILCFTFHVSSPANPYIGSGKLDGGGIPPDFFADVNVRKGFAYSFDYNRYLQDTFDEKASQAKSPIPPRLFGHNPGQKTYRYDLPKAREHFQKALQGQVWDKGFQLTLNYDLGNMEHQRAAEILKNGVESVHRKFKIDVKPLPWDKIAKELRRKKLPLFVIGWAIDYADPHSFSYPLLHSQGTIASKQGYRNSSLDQWIEEAALETDPQKRDRLYRKIQWAAYEDAPQIWITSGLASRVQRSRVKGWSFNPLFPGAPHFGYYYELYKEE